jgi:hypothetical protein
MFWRRKLPYIESLFEKAVHAIRRVMPQALGFDLIHSTYGHMWLAKLKYMVDSGYSDAHKLRANETFACSVCEAANAKRESCSRQYDLAATHANHTLHTDLLISLLRHWMGCNTCWFASMNTRDMRLLRCNDLLQTLSYTYLRRLYCPGGLVWISLAQRSRAYFEQAALDHTYTGGYLRM